MSLESFISMEGGEGMSEAAFEAFKERMKAAAAQIAAIKKEEKKQKKKEDELIKVLLKFIKTSHKKELVLLISRCLEQNIPANFILAVVLLSNEDIQKEIASYLMLKTSGDDEKSLTFFGEADQALPLKLKIEIDHWIKNMLSQAQESPQKLIKTSYEMKDEEKIIKSIIIQLICFILRDFLEQNKVDEPYEKLYNFSEFILKGILNKTEDFLDNQNLITN